MGIVCTKSHHYPGMTDIPHPKMLHLQHQDLSVSVERGKKGFHAWNPKDKIRDNFFFPKVSFVQHLGAILFHVDAGSRARGPSGLPQAPAVPNPNISGCLRSSPTHASPGQTDRKAFSASARARGYLGTWSVIALQSLPAALKISTSPQHAGTPIFIQKRIWEAEAKTSAGCCGLEKSYYGHRRENIGGKRTV